MKCTTCGHMIYESDLTLAKFDMLDSCCKDTLDDMRHDPDPQAHPVYDALQERDL